MKQVFHRYSPIPAGSQVYLERPRINRLLEKAAQKPVVGIVAGPGYGKTHAVYTFAKSSNAFVAWIQFTEKDNKIGHFWGNYISAISAIDRNTAQKLEKINFPENNEDFEKYLEIPRNDIIPNEKYLFVFDDLHLVKEKRVLYFLERRVTTSFFNASSILISRAGLPFDMKKMASKKMFSVISGEDLAFNRQEMASYFHIQKINPTPQTKLRIYRDTEGWPFAIHLAVLTFRNDSVWQSYMPQALKANIFRLIESEIIASISAGLRKFLIRLSLLDNLSPDLINEIAYDPSVIKEMINIESFVSFDSYLNSFRIHSLFLEYLKERQSELSCKEKKEVWNTAALWCSEKNLKMDALVYYKKSLDYCGIINLLSTLPMVLPTPIALCLSDILDCTPESAYRDFPMLYVVRTRALISLGRYEQGYAVLQKNMPELNAMPESAGKHRILLACNMHFGFIGFILVSHTKRYDFIHYFKAAAAEAAMSGHVTKAPLNAMSIGFHVCRVTDPSPREMEKFISVLGEMVPYAAAAMSGCLSGMYDLALGEYAFYRGNTAEAEGFLLKAYGTAVKHGQYETENRALFYLLRIYLSRGNIRETENIFKLLEDEVNEELYSNRYYHHDIVTGWYYIQTGRKNEIASWLKSDYAESGVNTRSHGLEKLIKARYYLAEKRYPAALAALENRENFEIFIMGSVEMKAVEAICLFRLGDRNGAYKSLKEAYRLGSPAGLFMPFAELGKEMRSLAKAVMKDNAPGLPARWLEETLRTSALYVKKLYRITGKHGCAGENAIAPLLSDRETGILTGLAHGLTREEIAASASISPNTVKSVTRSIYNKLGALNQADAVRIATVKGILP